MRRMAFSMLRPEPNGGRSPGGTECSPAGYEYILLLYSARQLRGKVCGYDIVGIHRLPIQIHNGAPAAHVSSMVFKHVGATSGRMSVGCCAFFLFRRVTCSSKLPLRLKALLKCLSVLRLAHFVCSAGERLELACHEAIFLLHRLGR